MKRDMNDLDLKNAFAPTPDACRTALVNAARSVKEEKQVKRASFRAVLIAAVIIIGSMTMAFAAQQLGWVDFFGSYDNVTVPQAAQQEMNLKNPIVTTVGPMTFTYTQLLTDGHIAMSAAEVHTTDGSEALYAPDSDIYDAVDGLSDVILKKYNLTSGTTWMEAAQQLNLPLYGVRALSEIGEEYSGGVAMEDPLYNTDGSLVYFSMPFLNKNAVKDELPMTLYMAVRRYDPKTGDEVEKWVERKDITISVSKMLEEKTYLPEGSATVTAHKVETGDFDKDGNWTVVTSRDVEMQVVSVRAERYVTGIYIYTTLKAPEGLTEDEYVQAGYHLTLCDKDGNPLPGGINLSGDIDIENAPTLVLENMTSSDALPDAIIVSDDVNNVVVK